MFGAVPALALMFVFDWLDRKRPEPPWRLRWVAFTGMLSVVPLLFIEVGLGTIAPPPGTWTEAAYHSFVVAAAPEEAAKAACLWLFVWRRPEFDERLDGIVYAAHVGLGFALVENVGYLFGVETSAQYWRMFVVRAVLAVPGHALWASVMGYYAARKRFDHQGPGLWGGLLLAWAMHGVYDFALMSVPLSNARQLYGLSAALAMVAVLVIVVGAMVVREMARRALAADDRAEALAAR